MFYQSFSILSIVLLLTTTVVLVLFFSFLKSYLPLFFKRFSENNYRIKRWFYIAEVITIVTVLIVFISYSSSKNIILAAILTLLLLIVFYFLSVFFVKDYLVGLLIKSSGEYRIGDQISVENTSGRITRLGKTQLKVKDANGDNIYLPYSLLITKIKSLQQQREKVNGYSFQMRFAKRVAYNTDMQLLQQHIQTLPWVHPSYQPDIKLEKEEEEYYDLSITVYAFDKKYYRKIKKAVLNEFKN